MEQCPWESLLSFPSHPLGILLPCSLASSPCASTVLVVPADPTHNAAYTVTVVTGAKRDADSAHNVWLRLHGERGATDEIWLVNDPKKPAVLQKFAAVHTNAFDVRGVQGSAKYDKERVEDGGQAASGRAGASPARGRAVVADGCAHARQRLVLRVGVRA